MIGRDEFKFSISDEQFRYLSVQRCASEGHLLDRSAFEANYHREIFDVYESIAPFLPDECESLLDIGSGLGGIDAVLNKHFGGNVVVYPLDGLADDPQVESHSKTFNNREVTRDFLTANGVSAFSYYTPQSLKPIVPFDLIVSFASYCFHYGPSVYLNFVKACARPGTVLIFDVRRKNAEWFEILAREFKLVGHAAEMPKFRRMIYEAR